MKNVVIERIKKIKKTERLTNETFAEKTLLSVETIKSMFSKKTNPNVETLSKIKSAFPLYSLDWIITGNGCVNVSDISVSDTNDYKEKYYALLEENKVLSQKHTQALEKVITLHEMIEDLSEELGEIKKEIVSGVLDVRDVLMKTGS
jgi:transcriptional regulator with XRE-family HTH domain